MHFTKLAILATAGLVAAKAAPQPQITDRAVLPRDIIPDDVESWAEGQASKAGGDAEDWVKSHYSEAKSWASEHGGDAKSWAQDHASDAKDEASKIASRASTAVDGAETKIDSISSRVRTAISDASASASASASAAANDDNGNAAVSIGGQAGVVAMMAALGAAVFGFMA